MLAGEASNNVMHEHGDMPAACELDMAELSPVMKKKVVRFDAQVQELAEFTVVGCGRRSGKNLKVSLIGWRSLRAAVNIGVELNSGEERGVLDDV